MTDPAWYSTLGATRFLWATTLCLLTLFITPDAAAEQRFSSGDNQVTLVELFTSQGCSSCPPAERWLGSLKDDPRLWKELVPVAFHVDYWDYIGWKDSFADPAYTARQSRYRREGALSSVYTPGFVVSGNEWRGWFRGRQLPHVNAPGGKLDIVLEKGELTAVYQGTGKQMEEMTLHIALLGVGLQVDVDRGENSGRKLTQDFTVLSHQSLNSSDGTWKLRLPLFDQAQGVRPAIAAWVSGTESQTPLQAVGGWLDSM